MINLTTKEASKRILMGLLSLKDHWDNDLKVKVILSMLADDAVFKNALKHTTNTIEENISITDNSNKIDTFDTDYYERKLTVLETKFNNLLILNVIIVIVFIYLIIKNSGQVYYP